LPRAKRKPARRPLSRERIELAALALFEREGVGGFSIRKLAADLGCQAMSIYHYFPSKAHLVDALLDRVVSGIPIPASDLPWVERVQGVARAYRAMALAHPKFFQFAVVHRMNTTAGLRFLEEVLTIFRDAGFDAETTARLFRAFSYYVSGAALDEAAGYAKGPSAVEPPSEEVVAREFPLVTAAGPYFKPQHHEATFETGLKMMLDGIIRRAPDAGTAA
jgi:AcrR family transcriptional regulator